MPIMARSGFSPSGEAPFMIRRGGKKWCRLRDSNTRPSHYECDALPTELKRHAGPLIDAKRAEFKGAVRLGA